MGFACIFPCPRQEMSEEIRPLYLDAQATTPLDPRVLDSMLPFMTSFYGNPHSRTHKYGWESEDAMEEARKVADTFLLHIQAQLVTVTPSGQGESVTLSNCHCNQR